MTSSTHAPYGCAVVMGGLVTDFSIALRTHNAANPISEAEILADIKTAMAKVETALVSIRKIKASRAKVKGGTP